MQKFRKLPNNKEAVVIIKSMGKLNSPVLKLEILFENNYCNTDVYKIKHILEWIFYFKMDLKMWLIFLNP